MTPAPLIGLNASPVSPGAEPPPTGVYLAEGQPIFQQAIAGAIGDRPGLALLGMARDGTTALGEIRSLSPDVAILDAALPVLSGVEVMRVIARDALPTRVVMLTATGPGALVYDTMNLGCAAFLTKTATLADICDAVAAVARGETVIAAELQAGLVSELREHAHTDRPLLTARETEVLRLVADGLTGSEIAARLFISQSTVKAHVRNVREKLGVHDRAAAVAEAMRRGLIV
jgi:two-component system nitrate/nitrite response regulator NarL